MIRLLTSKTASTALLVPAALALAIGCGGAEGGGDQSASADSHADHAHDDHDHADHDHADHADHDHAADDHSTVAASSLTDSTSGAETPVRTQAAQDSHAGHDHGHDHDHDHGMEGPPPIVRNEEMIASGEGPRVTYEIGRDSVDFGRVTQGAVLNHTYDMMSGGNADLIITQIKPTCGCTVAKLNVENDEGEMVEYTFGDPIPPGRKLELPAKMHTKNKRGNQTVRINIFSNDPRAQMQLGMKASIDPFFNVTPGFLTFGKVSVGEQVTKTATITTAKGQPTLLSLVDHTTPAGASIDLTPKTPDADGRSRMWELTVTLGPDLTEGNLARALQIVSDIEIEGQELHEGEEAEVYEAGVTISAEVVGPFTFTPSYLSFGLVRPGELRTRSVRIDGHDTEFPLAQNLPTVRVVGAPVANEPGVYQDWDLTEYFVAEVKPVEGQNSVDIELRLEGLPEEKRGSFGGMLLVDLGHPKKPEIELRVTGVCRGGAVDTPK